MGGVVGAMAGASASSPVIGAAFGLVGGMIVGLVLGLEMRANRATQPPPTPSRADAATGVDVPSDVRVLLDGVPSPVLGLDARGVVVACNAAAEAFLRPRAVVGRPLEELFTQAEVLVQHAEAVRGVSGRGEVRVTVGDAVRWFEVVTVPAGDGRIAAVMTLRDVTELAAAVQLKTDFVANASHELRTPLSSIRAAADTLAGGAWNDAGMRDRFIGMISANAGRLEEMVRDLLDLSRLESPDVPLRVADVAASDVMSGLRETLETAARERGVGLVFEMDPALERMRTDAKLLTLILKNLVDNAVKFAYEGTSVRVVGEAEGEAARFRVIDRGVGIPIEMQGRVFERFFQVDAARTGTAQRRGTGLGLAIVKHAVKALGGTIAVESVWKEGTIMTLVVPGCVVVGGAMADSGEVRESPRVPLPTPQPSLPSGRGG